MGKFSFKQFEVDDSRCGMKVGTDSVLLGAWTPAPVADNARFDVLDIGTGCGLLALMIAQRFANASVTAIEIDPTAADAARENVARSPWTGRIDVLTGDIMAVNFDRRFDLIISNPPFFKETILSPEAKRSLARHGDGFDLLTLISLAPGLLNENGLLTFVAPAARDAEITFNATMAGLMPIAKCPVARNKSRQPTRTLYAFTPRNSTLRCPDIPTHLYINDSTGLPSDQYRALTSTFYLNF